MVSGFMNSSGSQLRASNRNDLSTRRHVLRVNSISHGSSGCITRNQQKDRSGGDGRKTGTGSGRFLAGACPPFCGWSQSPFYDLFPDKAGRRTKQAFKSENRTGYLNLVDYYQVYSYDTTKKWLTKIARDGVLYGAYQYNDEDGRMTRVNFGTGPHAEYGYDASGALTKIGHFDKDGTLLASAAYEFDLAGNVTKAALDDSLTYKGDATVTYLYDRVNRLTKESCAKAAGSYRTEYDYSYWFDAVGNRTKMVTGDGTTTYLYTARNELTKTTIGGNDTLYTYDYRGNLTKKGSVEYSWDSQDHMTKVVNGNTTVEFKYDLMGRRVAKKVNDGAWWWYFYDGLKVLAEGSNTSTNRVFYTLGEGAVGGILYRDRYGTKYAYHYDRLGNVMAVTDLNGAAYAVYTMDAFGNVLEKGTSTGYSSEHATDPQPYHLTTKEYDPDVGLYYFNARWYDPATGRFVSRAPVPAEREHPYTFCQNQPTAKVDPTGELLLELLIGVCIVGIAGIICWEMIVPSSKCDVCKTVAKNGLNLGSIAESQGNTAYKGSNCEHWLNCAAHGTWHGRECGSEDCQAYLSAALQACASIGITIVIGKR
jgi:RHS repeat-associated protein